MSGLASVVKLGWTNPLTDAFGAHPLLGAVLDLNDGATFTVVSPDGLELSAPEKTLVPTGNIRTQGERVTRAIYHRNRTAVLRLIFGPSSSYAAFIASVRSLIRWIDAPPATPITLQWQPPNASAPVYLDVVGAAHALPADERDWLRLQVEPVELVFVVRPGLRGDRVTLSNLVSNPGFEAPSGPITPVFNDSFANLNAYTTLFGGAPSVSGNQMTMAPTSAITFGSPSWGAINLWQLRWRWQTNLAGYFYLHYTDTNNNLGVLFDGNNLQVFHTVGGVYHALLTGACGLGNGTWYWLEFTQFPSAPGTQCDVVATLYSDSGGAIGTQLTTSGIVATYDGVTALSGKSAIQANNTNMLVGGAYTSVHVVSLFGPGGWICFGAASGSTGLAAGAWERNTANTYTGGAVTSYGAARLDLAPGGTVSAGWTPYAGGAPGGTSAIPASAGQTLGLSAYAKSSGLHATHASVLLQVNEYDASGNILRQDTITSALGGTTNGGWTQLSGAVTLGASCAYVAPILGVMDTSVAGESAGATVWFDNMQCWNQTTTGLSSMPYCELRFPQSPAQLLLTGLLGDLPAPALLAWATYLASWPLGSTLSYAIGRRGSAAGSAANARLVGVSHGFYGTALSPTATAVLDSGSYGGYYISAAIGNGWNPRAFSCAPSDALGVYHLFARLWTNQAAGNLPNVQTRVVTQQKTSAWYGATNNSDQLGTFYGPYVAPISASSTWTPSDAGQANVPALPAGALTDLTQTYLTPRPQFGDTTGGGSTGRANWQLLLPIDGSLVMGLLNNPSNAPFAVTTSWLWVYHDGLLLNRSGIGDGAATTYSIESTPLANPSHGGGGPGTSGTGAINVNSGADASLTLDPTLTVAAVSGASGTAAGGSGVNQLAGYVADNNGAVLPLHCEIQYSPLYLYPR